MKILTLIDTLYPAGAETIAVSIAELLQEQGRYEPIVCATRAGGNLETGLRTQGIRHLILGRRSKFEIHKMRALFTLVRDERVGIVHAHGAGSGVWGVLLARATGVPLVTHVHGQPLVGWHGTADALIGRLAKRVIAVSEFERHRLISQGLPETRVVAIPNGIDIDGFAAATAPAAVKVHFGIPQDAPVVGICAGLRPEKNHEMFLEAAAVVVAGGIDARFMIVGGGERGDALKAQARTLGIAERCVFTGSVANVPELLAAFDVGVLSSNREGLPLSILEYMASSLPVVATNVAAIPEAVEEGKNGFLVPPGDSEALADRIGRLLTDSEFADRMGREGRRMAEARFSRRAMIARVQALYDEVLAENR